MIASPMGKTVWAFALIVASCGSADGSVDSGAERWRQWFERRAFGEDPYFFFPAGATGPTGCPENRRLSYAGADSVGVRLSVIDERGASPQVRARCTVRFSELRGNPVVQALPDGRAMWALRVAADVPPG